MKAENITIRRLKKLSKTLRRVADGKLKDEERPESGTVPYDQEAYLHECGTPACAFGWHMSTRPGGLSKLLPKGAPIWDFIPQEFPGLSSVEIRAIFGSLGCNNAGRNAAQAADYIERFIQSKLVEG